MAIDLPRKGSPAGADGACACCSSDLMAWRSRSIDVCCAFISWIWRLSAAISSAWVCGGDRDNTASSATAESFSIGTVDSTKCSGEDLAGVQDPVRVECPLDALHQRNLVLGQLQRQERRLRKADAVLAADRPFKRDDARKQHVLRGVRPLDLLRIVRIHHEIDVNVAVSCMPETGNPQAILLLDAGDEREQFRNAPLGHDHIMVELE